MLTDSENLTEELAKADVMLSSDDLAVLARAVPQFAGLTLSIDRGETTIGVPWKVSPRRETTMPLADFIVKRRAMEDR
jgi:hypothetical protein